MGIIALAILALAGASAAHAGPALDGSAPMKCSIQTVMVCNSPDVCVRGSAQTVLLPPTIMVDVPQRLISGAATGRTARITSTAKGPGKLMIAGEDSQTLGKMWGLVVDQEAGAMSGAVLSHGGGFLMFGQCGAP